MPRVPDSFWTPADVYKLFIDTLATETSDSVRARLVAADGYFSHATEHEPLDRFVARLSPDQRQLLAEMLRNERQAAIHDVLALLSWLIQCHDVDLTFRGEAMPVALLDGPGLHGDYICRRQGEEWPDRT